MFNQNHPIPLFVKITIFTLCFSTGRRRVGCVHAFSTRTLPIALLEVAPHSEKLYSYYSTKIYSRSDSSSLEVDSIVRSEKKRKLMDLLSTVPSNKSTPTQLTSNILSAVRDLEEYCPTEEAEVLTSLSGNWELLWTAQDKSSKEGSQSPILNWINPLENQSYSNNPNGSSSLPSQLDGRSNPILPQNIQNKLEEMGILQNPGNTQEGKARSSNSPAQSNQIIDLKKKRVRNIVSFEARSPMKLPLMFPSNREEAVSGFLTVDVDFEPNKYDARRVDVKFRACRLSLKKTPLDIKIPLGVIGPTGWLRTCYIDEDIRVTRGHKGSVFILSRTSQKNFN